MPNWLSHVDQSIRLLNQNKLPICYLFLSATLSSSAFAATVGYWKFESGISDVAAIGPGSIIDSSASKDHGTPIGNPAYRSDVPTDPIPQTQNVNLLSLELSDGAEVHFNSKFIFHETGDATMEFWIKSPLTNHSGALWTRADDDDANRFNFWINSDNTFGMDYRSPTGELHRLLQTSIPSNTWVHLGIVRINNEYSIYRDGTLVGVATDINPDLPDSIGWQLSGRTDYNYVGYVDSLRVSDVALQPHEFLNAIAETNAIPVAVAGTSLDPSLAIQLDASLSSDNDNDLLNFAWLIEGEAQARLGEIVLVSHLQAGDYQVTLTVDDGNGGISMDSMLLAIPESTIETHHNTVDSLIGKLKIIRRIVVALPSLAYDGHREKMKKHHKRKILKAIDKVAVHLFTDNFQSAYDELLSLEDKLSSFGSRNHRKDWVTIDNSPILGPVTDLISDLLVICGDCSRSKDKHKHKYNDKYKHEDSHERENSDNWKMKTNKRQYAR